MNIVCGVEFMNDNYNPFDVKLQGWSEEINENVDDFDEVLGELYEKYKGDGKKMEPEIKMAFMLFGSAATFHAKNTIFNKMPQMNDILKSQTGNRTEKNTTYSDEYVGRSQANVEVEEFKDTFPVRKEAQVKGLSKEHMKKTLRAKTANARKQADHLNSKKQNPNPTDTTTQFAGFQKPSVESSVSEDHHAKQYHKQVARQTKPVSVQSPMKVPDLTNQPIMRGPPISISLSNVDSVKSADDSPVDSFVTSSVRRKRATKKSTPTPRSSPTEPTAPRAPPHTRAHTRFNQLSVCSQGAHVC